MRVAVLGAGAPRSDDPGWRAGLEGEHGRPGRQARRRPEEVDARAVAAQRAIGHERRLSRCVQRALALGRGPVSGTTFRPVLLRVCSK